MFLVSLVTVGLASAVGPLVGVANDVVEIRLRGHYFVEPATVRITIAVEPDALNRSLTIEADSEWMFRSSQIHLPGADAQRIHTVELRGLPAGEYMLSAQVYSQQALRGVATQSLTVTGGGR